MARIGINFRGRCGDLLGHHPELSLAGAHGLEGIQVALQFFLFGSVQAGLYALYVIGQEVEQVGVDVKVLAGVSGGARGEELLVGLHRVEESRQGVALARRGEVVGHRHGLVRYAQADVRVNAAQFAGEGGVDGFPVVLLAHGPATEGGKPHVVSTAGDATRETVDHCHLLGPRRQGFHGHAHGMPVQRTLLQFGGILGEFDSLWLDVAWIQAVTLHEEKHAGRLGRSLARRFKLADERCKIEAAQTEGGSAEEGASRWHDRYLFVSLNKKESEE